MKRRSPFAAAGMVLGAVACIVMLAILAARGGGGDSDEAPGPKSGRLAPRTTGSPVADAERVVVEIADERASADYLNPGSAMPSSASLSVIAGQQNTVTIPAP